MSEGRSAAQYKTRSAPTFSPFVQMTEILALIPARGGSQGVPRKNIRLLAGKPLIAWTIETALACAQIDRLVVSTDDAEIAEIARQYGAETPFMQPAELALSNVPDFPVGRYALTWLGQNLDYHPDMIAWLRPTAPLRRVQDIQAAVEILLQGGDCVRSVSPVKDHPYWMKRIQDDRLVPFLENGLDERQYPQRQMLPPVFMLNGVIDVTWSRNVLERGYLFGGDMRPYVIPAEISPDLDTELDFVIAETLMQRRLHA